MQSLAEQIEFTKHPDTRPLLVVVTACGHCPNSDYFRSKLEKIEKAFEGKMTIVHLEGNSGNYDANPPQVKEALEMFKWGDGSHHYPCGALFAHGREIYHLPTDQELAHKVTAESLGNELAKAAYINSFDRTALLTKLQSDALDLLVENQLGIKFSIGKFSKPRYIESKGDEADACQRLVAIKSFMSPALLQAVHSEIGTHIEGNQDKGTVRLELGPYVSDDIQAALEKLARNLADYGVNYPGSDQYITRTH